MTVSSVAGMQNKLAQSLVAARGVSSPFSSALASATNALSPSTTPSPQQAYNQSLSNLQTKLNTWFQGAGVDTSQEIQLSLTADGTVQLANSHPDADKIEQVLQNHPELLGMFQTLSNSYKQLNQPDNSGTTSPTPQFIVTLTDGTATATTTS
jgi:hypothetical protein